MEYSAKNMVKKQQFVDAEIQARLLISSRRRKPQYLCSYEAKFEAEANVFKTGS